MRLFISYSRKNRPQVETLVTDLESIGHDVWFDKEISGGQVWWSEALRQIREADLFVFVLTRASLDSYICGLEYKYAHDLNKRILPVLLDNTNTNLLPPQLSMIQFVDYRQRDMDAIKRLSRALMTLPSAQPMPNPLPPDPEVPMSALGKLNEQVNAPSLDIQQQKALLFDLKQLVEKPDQREDARVLLKRLYERQDLNLQVGKEIEGLLATKPGFMRRTRPDMPTPKQPKPKSATNAAPQSAMQLPVRGLLAIGAVIILLGIGGFVLSRFTTQLPTPTNINVAQAPTQPLANTQKPPTITSIPTNTQKPVATTSVPTNTQRPSTPTLTLTNIQKTTATTVATDTKQALTSTPTSTNTQQSLPTVGQSSITAPTTTARLTANNQWKPQFQTFDGVEMAKVPPGCFKTDCFDVPFWIDKTEVTQEQFKKFGGKAGKPSAYLGDKRPVQNITYYEALSFCEQRGARLPTEMEWEYAAGGPDNLDFPWGNTFDGNRLIWNRSESIGPANAGTKLSGASWVGALDMSGNVWEWVKGYTLNMPATLHGGSWYDNKSSYFHNDYRTPMTTSYDYNVYFVYVGFRCARS